MPDPYRHYEGVPVLDLPADPVSPEVPAIDVLLGRPGARTVMSGGELLSSLLYHSAAISAAKRVPSTGYRYALRVNPSSGNLHPTEFHFIARGLADWPDGAYHYRPSSHMAEQRALGTLDWPESDAPLVFVLTSIAWREAWKYRDRAYRYCMHDIGHAWQALALAAAALGLDARATGQFEDQAIASRLHLHDDEWPMLLVEIDGPALGAPALASSELKWFGGEPNRLSEVVIGYPSIDDIHGASMRLQTPRFEPILDSPPGAMELPAPLSSTRRPFGATVRARRSALDFEPAGRMSLVELSTLLASATAPLVADFLEQRFVELYLYVHAVDPLNPGVYRYHPSTHTLELVRAGGQRVAAAGLSLGQDLAGNACIAFSMIGDLERATHSYGDRGYRYVYFEAGAIGQRLYIAAEALGLRATGIGAFFDDRVHEYLGMQSSGPHQVIYHFAIGHAVPDLRVEA